MRIQRLKRIITNHLAARLTLAFLFVLFGIQGVSSQTILYPRTNLLVPLMNAGLEIPIGTRWSVGVDYYYPWFFRKSNNKNCFQIDVLSVEGRYWFGDRHADDPNYREYRLLGHSVGVFAATGHYDFERNYKGHQGEYILGGVDYLYAIPICKGKFHLEFSIGIGYLYSRATHYEVYEPGGAGYRDQNFRKKIQYFGPVKANVSLVIPLKLDCKKFKL